MFLRSFARNLRTEILGLNKINNLRLALRLPSYPSSEEDHDIQNRRLFRA